MLHMATLRCFLGRRCLAVGNLLDREQILSMCTSVVYVCLSAVSVAY